MWLLKISGPKTTTGLGLSQNLWVLFKNGSIHYIVSRLRSDISVFNWILPGKQVAVKISINLKPLKPA